MKVETHVIEESCAPRKLRGRSLLARTLARADAGAAIVELVVIVPLLLLILMATIEVGRFGDYAIKVGNAARAGVQYGAQNPATSGNNTGMQNAALADAQNITGLTAVASHFCICADGSASLCLQSDCSASHRLVYVKVIATGTLGSILNYSGLPASLRTVTIQNTAIMRVPQ